MQLQGPRTFLARPFWRDYVVAFLLIGMGAVLGDLGLSHRPPRSPMLVPACVLLFAGFAVFSCAVVWSLCWTCRAWRSRELPDDKRIETADFADSADKE
jgi:hypothetical protein